MMNFFWVLTFRTDMYCVNLSALVLNVLCTHGDNMLCKLALSLHVIDCTLYIYTE